MLQFLLHRTWNRSFEAISVQNSPLFSLNHALRFQPHLLPRHVVVFPAHRSSHLSSVSGGESGMDVAPSLNVQALENQFEELRHKLEDTDSSREHIRNISREIESTTRLMHYCLLHIHSSRPIPGMLVSGATFTICSMIYPIGGKLPARKKPVSFAYTSVTAGKQIAAVTTTALVLSAGGVEVAGPQQQEETLSNIPQTLSSVCTAEQKDCKRRYKIQRPKSRKAEIICFLVLLYCVCGPATLISAFLLYKFTVGILV